jgi:hypothetical protein
MRTTITIDDRLAGELKRLSAETGKPFKSVLNETLRAGLHGHKKPAAAYRLRTASMGLPRAGANLNKALQLTEELEDVALRDKLEQRK